MHVNGIELHVEDTGPPAASGPGTPICFSHGLLWSARMFEPQIAALRDRWRCVAWDHRGQGRSEKAPSPGGKGDAVAIETVYDDAVALLEAMNLGPVHFVGLSMGGFVGMRLAARRPDLVRSLTLLETAADPEPAKNHRTYGLLNLVARLGGIRFLSGRVMPIMFSRSFLADPTRAADRARWVAELTRNAPSIYRAVNGVIRRESVEHEIARIDTPTLVLHGEEDAAIALPRAERMAAGIRGARLVTIPRAGHTSTVEEPEAVTRELRAFLEGVEG